MAHDTLMSYWSRLNLKTCYHWAILAVFVDDSVGLASWADVAVVVFFPPSSLSVQLSADDPSVALHLRLERWTGSLA